MVKLNLDKGIKFKMNNWTKFFLCDALISAGLWACEYNLIFPASFCIIGGTGLVVNLVYNGAKYL